VDRYIEKIKSDAFKRYMASIHNWKEGEAIKFVLATRKYSARQIAEDLFHNFPKGLQFLL
jgi:hypothetical protein